MGEGKKGRKKGNRRERKGKRKKVGQRIDSVFRFFAG